MTNANQNTQRMHMFSRFMAFQITGLALLLFAGFTPAQTQIATSPPPRQRPPLIAAIKGEQAIELHKLSIQSDISGGLAETTVRMTFYNPNNRQLEGNLQFPLLDGQQITAFALDINGALRQAVPVEKAKGRQVFEEIERRGVDPGLLENTQGNNFKLRIYPIAAKGVRTVELKYSEALKRQDGKWLHTLPLAYGDAIKSFELRIKANGLRKAPKAIGNLGKLDFERRAKGFETIINKNNFSPRGSLTLEIPASEKPETYIQTFNGQTYFIAEVPVKNTSHERTLPSTIGLLWDSSGSGANRNHDLELNLLDRYFNKAQNIEVRLTRLRDRAEAVEIFRIQNGDWSTLRKSLKATVYDGASALSEWKVQNDVAEYLLFSDGLSNYGNGKFPGLSNAQRLYAINTAVSSDNARLTAVAENSGGKFISLQTAEALTQASSALLSEGVYLQSLDGTGLTNLEFASREPQDGFLYIAGRMLAPNATLDISVNKNGNTSRMQLAITADSAEHPLAAKRWASYRLRALDMDHEQNRAAIRRIGEQFSLPTRETSLIVLETVEDYVRYNIAPPAELRNEYAALINSRDQDRKGNRDQHLQKVIAAFEQKYIWWKKVFPKSAPPKPKQIAEIAVGDDRRRRADGSPPPPPPPPSLARPMVVAAPVAPSEPPMPQSAPAADAAAPAGSLAESKALESISVTGSQIARASTEEANSEEGNVNGTIALKKWTSDAPYIKRMKAASKDSIYAVYLDEKPSYLNSSAFFLDAADMLMEKNQPDLALRVLSNLAEMDLENRHILRILGYRLMQANAPELAVPVFEKVQLLAEEEPQSFRDLGLALAATKQDQKAIEQLYEVVLRNWDDRFAEIELITLAELNAIIATSKTKLDTSAIDTRLIKSMPLDLRVILTWDADNSDMDLWVTDPNGEKSFYGHKDTYQGGHMSDDFTGGYGPEEFSLRSAKPGKYKVEVNFFGNRQQVVAGATTLQVYLTTGFGTAKAKQQSVTLRLKEASETVFVGEFEVKP
jgi:Ca-activated chloride channel homolog